MRMRGSSGATGSRARVSNCAWSGCTQTEFSRNAGPPLNGARMIANRGLGEDTMHRRMMTFRFSPFYRLGFSGAVALLTVSAWAADEKMAVLKAGSQTFTNVTVLNRTADQLCITHAGGIANV